MDSVTIALLMIIALFVLVLAGMHIGVSLSLLSLTGVYLISGGKAAVALGILSNTAYDAVRTYSFAVIPLFILMGSFISNSGVAKDLFAFANRILGKVPGGLAIATVVSNAIFAAVTGVSVASAAVFSKIALGEMLDSKYSSRMAVGTIAGSSVLGMLIPPSVLMIVYGMTAEVSIGKLFVAGILPGILLACIFSVGILIMTHFNPREFGREKGADGKYYSIAAQHTDDTPTSKILARSFPIFVLIFVILGGIWGGQFTPVEASAIGALGACLILIGKYTNNRKVGISLFKQSLLETASTTSSILFLLISSSMYSRMLTLSGAVTYITNLIVGMDVSKYVILSIFIVAWILLGCILDSTSIVLLTIPILAPVATQLGFDLIWFGIIAIIVIEMGLVTPPFGMVVFSIKATMKDQVSIEEAFKGSMIYVLMMLICVIILIACPALVTFLPNTM